MNIVIYAVSGLLLGILLQSLTIWLLRSLRSATINKAANHSFNLSFTVRSGTTRMRHCTMAGYALARFGNGQNHAFPSRVSGELLGRATKSMEDKKRMEPRERVLPRGSPFFLLLG